MAKAQKTQQFIYKINSSLLKQNNWDLELSLSDARKIPGVVVSLADSQILTWINELNGTEDYDSRAKQIKNDIKEIKINIKPYNYIKMVQSDYEPNLSKTNGRSTGSVEHRNKVTVLKSYELNIITKDKNINLIVFKDPNIFFRR